MYMVLVIGAEVARPETFTGDEDLQRDPLYPLRLANDLSLPTQTGKRSISTHSDWPVLWDLKFWVEFTATR